MKPLTLLLFFFYASNHTSAQNLISEDLIRRVVLTFIRDLSQSNSINIGTVTFDYDDDILFLQDGNQGVKVRVKWTSKVIINSEPYWLLGYVAKNQNTGQVFWITEKCSQGLNHHGKYYIANLDSEENIIKSMGIGKPMRKKSANTH